MRHNSEADRGPFLVLHGDGPKTSMNKLAGAGPQKSPRKNRDVFTTVNFIVQYRILGLIDSLLHQSIQLSFSAFHKNAM